MKSKKPDPKKIEAAVILAKTKQKSKAPSKPKAQAKGRRM